MKYNLDLAEQKVWECEHALEYLNRGKKIEMIVREFNASANSWELVSTVGFTVYGKFIVRHYV